MVSSIPAVLLRQIRQQLQPSSIGASGICFLGTVCSMLLLLYYLAWIYTDDRRTTAASENIYGWLLDSLIAADQRNSVSLISELTSKASATSSSDKTQPGTRTTAGQTSPSLTASYKIDDALSQHDGGRITAGGYFINGGRLGNKLFIYATILGLAQTYNLTPVFEVRHAIFDVFNLSAKVLVRSNVTWHRQLSEECCGCFSNKTFHVIAQNRTANYRIAGWLQSFKYFDAIRDQVRTSEYRFRSDIVRTATDLRGIILKEHCPNNSFTEGSCLLIGMHNRRGDFLGLIGSGWNVAGADYFNRSMALYTSKFSQNRIVFAMIGDDYAGNLALLKNLSGLPYKTVALKTGPSPYADLCFFSLCDHMIITAGTFSWWAGYLNRGQVIYFSDYPRNGSSLATIFRRGDYYPAHWFGL